MDPKSNMKHGRRKEFLFVEKRRFQKFHLAAPMSSDGDPRRLYVCRSNVFGPRRSTAAAVAPRPRLTLMGVLWQRVETPSTGSSRAGKDAVGGAVACVVGKRQVHPALGTHVAQIRAGLPSVCSCNLCNQKQTRISLPHGFRGK